MITLITGIPGTGKTALAVSMLLEEQGNRPLFISGIPELKVDHQLTPPVEEWTREEPTPEDEKVMRPIFNFPANSIIVIDEAQNVYRPRGVGSKVPPHVAAFETHRHTGVDFWLITQNPGLLDANIRKLVGRHIHIRDTVLGRFLYEWSECGDVESKSARDLSASRRYKLPKKVFSLYKSSSLHLKQKHRIPKAAYFLIFAFIAAPLIGYRIYTRMHEEMTQKNPFGPGKPGAPGAQGIAGEGGQVKPPVDMVASYQPRIRGLPHTAPRFDKVTEATTAPIPAACVATARDCRCWSQQATRIDVPAELCKQIVAHGFFIDFDPDGKKGSERQQASETKSAPSAVVDAGTVRIADPGAPVRYAAADIRPPVMAFDRELSQ